MNGRLKITLLVCILISFFLNGHASAQTGKAAYRIVGYYTAWSIYARQYFITDIPANELTDLNYAFINLSNSGECISGDEWGDTGYLYPGDLQCEPLRGNFKQLKLLKKAHPNLHILMSIGGWTWSNKFSNAALTPESRTRLATSCIAFMRRYGFDGIDIDWEFPVSGGLVKEASRPEDKANFTLLLAEFRQQLDSQDKRYLLTIAAPATRQFYENFELDQIGRYVDWVNLMSYTFHGGWSKMTNLFAPLYASSTDPSEDETMRREFNVDAVVKVYVNASIPSDKIVVGVPFYGMGWEGVPDVNNGLYQSFTGLPHGTWGDGIYDYRDLEAHYLSTYKRYWNADAQVPWLYSSQSQIMISYEDPQSLKIKADYVKQNHLGGIMIWEIDYDDKSHTLLRTVAKRLFG